VQVLEGLVERLADHAGLPRGELNALRDAADQGLTPEVRALADQGRQIHAIKEYRAATGAGLVEAKRAVEEYLGRPR
jgi:ribosomal protein L7/L12